MIKNINELKKVSREQMEKNGEYKETFNINNTCCSNVAALLNSILKNDYKVFNASLKTYNDNKMITDVKLEKDITFFSYNYLSSQVLFGGSDAFVVTNERYSLKGYGEMTVYIDLMGWIDIFFNDGDRIMLHFIFKPKNKYKQKK